MELTLNVSRKLFLCFCDLSWIKSTSCCNDMAPSIAPTSSDSKSYKPPNEPVDRLQGIHHRPVGAGQQFRKRGTPGEVTTQHERVGTSKNTLAPLWLCATGRPLHPAPSALPDPAGHATGDLLNGGQTFKNLISSSLFRLADFRLQKTRCKRKKQ